MRIIENKKRIEPVSQLGYDCKQNKKQDLYPFYYLTKKGFKNLCNDSDEQINVVGDVYINQRKYEDIETSEHPEKLEAKKERKDIIGIAFIAHSRRYIVKHPESENDKKFDLYKHSKFMRRTVGYAQTGENEYVRLVKTSLVPIFIILLLIALFACTFKGCPNFDPITINQGRDIVSTETTQPSAEICYYSPFEEVTVLTKDKPCISLINVSTNEDEYYISFSIYINGAAMKDEKGEIFTTGAIPPGRQVDINLFNELDEGVYELKAIATDYDFKTINSLVKNEKQYSDKEKAELLAKATMPVKHTLSTTLKVEKKS